MDYQRQPASLGSGWRMWLILLVWIIILPSFLILQALGFSIKADPVIRVAMLCGAWLLMLTGVYISEAVLDRIGNNSD